MGSNDGDSAGFSSLAAAGDEAFDNLYPAVVECFFVIICGYIAGKASIISPFEAKGLNTFVGTFALPALIFHSMAELDFSSVNWKFLLAIFLSKTAVFAIVAIITVLVSRPVDFGKSGLFAIFCTQSNDFALGYPIIVSLYKNIHPEFPSYLYLVAPVSLVFLNPIGFTLMEWQKRRDQRRQIADGQLSEAALGGNLCFQIVTGVAKNPVVIMTALGIVGNSFFNHCVPPVLAGILKVFASAYPATALFVLGLRLVGSLRRLHGAALVVPAILIMTKGLVLPLITREIVENLQPGSNLNETKDFSDYGFLYGTFPTAPPVFVYAAQYNIEVDMIASAMVIGTFLSALVMFVSAKMVTLTDVLPADYMAQLQVFLLNIAIFGILACIGVVIVFTLTRKWRKMPHFVTFCLVISQLIACIGVIMWSFVDCHQVWKLYIQFFVFAWGVFSTRIWTALLAFSLVLTRKRPHSELLKLRRYFPIVGWLLPALIVGCLLGFVATEAETAERRDPNFQYGRTQAIVALIVLIGSFLATVSCLIVQQRLHRYVIPRPHKNGRVLFEAGADETEDLLNEEDRADDSDGGRRVGDPFSIEDDDSMSSYGVASEMEVLEEVSEPPSGVSSNRQSFVRNRQADRDREDLIAEDRHEARPPTGGRVRRASEAAANRLRRQHTAALQQMRLSMLSMQDDAAALAVARPPSALQAMRACSTHFDSLMARSGVIGSVNPFLQSQEEKSVAREKDDEHQLLRHVILLLILCTSMLVGISLCLWTLIMEENSGIYIELVFLDVALNFGQGFFVFAIFGLDEKLVIAPVLKWWRRCFHGTAQVKPPPPENLSAETLLICQQFVTYHMDNCFRDIVRDRKFRNKYYKHAFCGNEFVDWVLVVGLAPDRAQATKYGKQLLNGRVLRHYDNEHHFHDQPLFYTFYDTSMEDFMFQPLQSTAIQ